MAHIVERQWNMGGGDDHASVFAMAAQDVPEPFDRMHVKSQTRLVQQPQRRLGQHDSGESRTSFLASGEKAHRGIGKVPQLEGIQSLVQRSAMREDGQIFDQGETGLQGVLMAEISNAVRMVRAVREGILPIPEQLARIRLPQTCQHSQQRGFSRPVRTRQQQGLS